MKLITSIIALLLAAFAAGPPDQFSRSWPTPSAAHDVFWGHVYNPTRTVQAPCVRVTGVIADATAGKEKDGLRDEQDGDSHGWLRLDPGQDKYLNDGNRAHEGGNLVFEVVCLFPVRQPDAVAACNDYHSPLVVPPVRTHVAIFGTWVLDDNHWHWYEIHPVMAIEVLR
jgi:hypothetical protein